MTKKEKKVSEQKNYAKPRLINYGDLTELTTTNRDATVLDSDMTTGTFIWTGPPADRVEETFEQFGRSSSSDSGGRGGRRGGE